MRLLLPCLLIFLILASIVPSTLATKVTPDQTKLDGSLPTSPRGNVPSLGGFSTSSTDPPPPKEFVKTWGGSSDDYGSGITLDSAGNSYVVGSTSSFPSGYWNVSLLKYNITGGLVWQKAWGGVGDDYGTGITLDSAGNIYVAGNTVSRCCSGDHNVFLLKFNSAGTLQWQKTWGSSTYDNGAAVAVDSSGNVYVVGDTQLGTIPYFYVALLKFDPSGNLLLQKTWCSACAFSQHATSVAVDSSDNVYVAGWVNTYGSQGVDVFLLKMDSSLNGLWAETWGGTATDVANGVAVDPHSGDVYVTGYTSSFGAGSYDAFILRFSSLSGSLQWQRTWGGLGDDEAAGIFVDHLGDFYVSGKTDSYGGMQTCGSYPSYYTCYDAFVLKFDSSLNLISSQTWGGASDDAANAITVDAAGDAVVTGSVRESSPYVMGSGNQTLHSPAFNLTTSAAGTANVTFGYGTLNGAVTSTSGSQSYAGGLDIFVASLPMPSSRATEFVLAALPTNPQATSNYTGPFMITAAAFNATGDPVQGLTVSFALPPTVDLTAQTSTFTNSLGVVNITIMPLPNFTRTSLFESLANDGSGLKDFTKVPYGTPIVSSGTGSKTSGSLMLSQVSMTSQGNLLAGDLTNACNSPFSSSTILQNSCPSGNANGLDLVKIACQDFKYAQLLACGAAALTILSCAATTTGVAALITAEICAGGADSITLTSGLCLDYILGAISQAVLHHPLPVFWPSDSVVENVLGAAGAGCDLYTLINASDSGGNAGLADGSANLFIPSHTIKSGSILIGISEIGPWESSSPIPSLFRQTGSLYRVSIGLDQTITTPAALTLKYSTMNVPPGYAISVYHDGVWSALSTTINNGNATAQITQPGDYAVFAAPVATPSLSPPGFILLAGLAIIAEAKTYHSRRSERRTKPNHGVPKPTSSKNGRPSLPSEESPTRCAAGP